MSTVTQNEVQKCTQCGIYPSIDSVCVDTDTECLKFTALKCERCGKRTPYMWYIDDARKNWNNRTHRLSFEEAKEVEGPIPFA